ncbi:uncharacterized protein N7482_004627 [Penicillium canariense]|uniref:Uncharacterized protein n=1 Tax=Penicillium canariense TaxID=189055 RepID=A0A9W9I930_9EURO|nr:uncharacterized protein N7482_004627 [Penicillium canariense]KAJ5169033.1 hypothetical protein N7482_004627 [Penicillium canariense]
MVERGLEANQNLVLEQNRLAVELLPPTCNLNACLGLTGTFSCIVSALGVGDTAALQRCLTNGLAEICSCAACVPVVSNILNSLGVCVTGQVPPGNITLTPFFNTFATATAVSRDGGVHSGTTVTRSVHV